MKKVSLVVPCYNEELNIEPLKEAITEEFRKLPQYDYEIIFIDNDSKDHTRDLIRLMAMKDPHVKGILNAKNFGQFNSPYYGLLQMTGDCVISLACDFQDPVEMIPKFLEGWEEGYKIVIGVKTKSKENPIIYGLRTLYYKLIRKFSNVEMIMHYTGFGLYDKEFIEVLRKLDDPTPFLRGIVAEIGFRHKEIPFTQPKRRAGKSSNGFYSLYDGAMLSFTSYTKIGLRLATFIGFGGSFASFVIALVYLILKLVNWYSFEAGMAPLIILVAALGSLQLLFIGLIGEYVLAINQRVMKRPLVVEEERVGIWEEPAPEPAGNTASEQGRSAS